MSLSEEIRQTFARAALQHIAAKGLNGDDWQRYRQIQDEHEARHQDAQRTYYQEYDARVETRRRQLIDEAAAKHRSFTPRWSAQDRFDRHALDQQAHRATRQDHDRLLEALAKERDSKIEDLLAASQKRLDLSNRLKQDVVEATVQRPDKDRRSGPAR